MRNVIRSVVGGCIWVVILTGIGMSVSPDEIRANTILDEDRQKVLEEQNKIIIQEQKRIEYERQEDERNALDKPVQNIEYQIPSSPDELTGNLPSFNITTIAFEGARVLPSRIYQKIKEPYLGQVLNINDINKIVHDLTNEYIERGYITTRVYIPKQNLKTETLKLKVVEGYIDKLTIQGAHPNTLLTAFGNSNNTLLNIRHLEQGLDNINRLQSNRAVLKLIPSKDKPGYTNVLIQNELGTQANVNVRYDTISDPNLRFIPNSLMVSYDNLLNINDYWSANYSQKSNGFEKFNNSVATSFSVPEELYRL